MIRASASAKIILVGEHAVVYGVPAIAIPLADIRAVASVIPGEPGAGLHIAAEDLAQVLPVDVNADLVDNALAYTARLVLKKLNFPPPDITITIQSQIPMASGLGSGAAVSTAVARALCTAIGVELSSADLNAIIYEVEKAHHGTPSGIDNTVIVYEQPVYFVREQPIRTLTVGSSFDFLIADTGKGALTKIAVGDVRTLYDRDRARTQVILDAIRSLVTSAKIALETGDLSLLGGLMTRNHNLLRELTVSSPELDTLVTAALNAGAAGAKLSGGGRGGNMIALVTPYTNTAVRSELIKAGAVRVISTTLKATT